MTDPTATSSTHGLETLLDEEQAGALLGLSISTLQKRRLTGDGPAYIKMGRAVRYQPSAIRAFIAAREVRSTSEVPLQFGRRAPSPRPPADGAGFERVAAGATLFPQRKTPPVRAGQSRG